MNGLGIFGWIALGGIAGWLAGRITGTSYRQGCLLDIVVGIAGALIGGFAFTFISGSQLTGFSLYSLLVAVLGAVVLLVIVKAVRGQD